MATALKNAFSALLVTVGLYSDCRLLFCIAWRGTSGTSETALIRAQSGGPFQLSSVVLYSFFFMCKAPRPPPPLPHRGAVSPARTSGSRGDEMESPKNAGTVQLEFNPLAFFLYAYFSTWSSHQAAIEAEAQTSPGQQQLIRRQ